MKRLATLLLALTAAGCGPAPVYRLSPMDADPRWLHGRPAMHRDSAGIETAIVFDRSVGGVLLFDVTIANHSDTAWLAGPEGFGYQLELPRGRMPKRLAEPVQALDPEETLARIDQWIAQEDARYANALGASVAFGMLDLIADVVSNEDERHDHDEHCDRHDDDERVRRDATHEAAMRRLEALREYWATHALRRTHVPAGGSVSGKVAVPARSLDALTATLDQGEADITRPREGPDRPSVVLTLRVPADSTAHGIAYRVLRM